MPNFSHTLQHICQMQLISTLEEHSFHPRMINDLCKQIPDFLLEPVLTTLLEKKVITDTALVAFLVPSRLKLSLSGAVQIRNSTLKQIGMNCPNLKFLNLSDCIQVSNAVVRSILQGCPGLQQLSLDRCHHVTDAAFDMMQSPFHILVGCQSLEMISLQGCPQVTGQVVSTLNKICHNLTHLNLSQCKQVQSPAIQTIFDHCRLKTLNLGFIDAVDDEVFLLLPCTTNRSAYYTPSVFHCLTTMDAASNSLSTALASHQSAFQPTHPVNGLSPLESLNLCKSKVTDKSMFRTSALRSLKEISLQWCVGISDQGIDALTTNCPSLTSMDLRSCQITDESIGFIARKCTQLTALDISWCNGITDSGILKLIPSCDWSEELASTRIAVGSWSNSTDMTTHTRTAIGTNLRYLSAVWCSQLTNLSIVQLSRLPELRQVEVAGCSSIDNSSIESLRVRGIIVNDNVGS